MTEDEIVDDLSRLLREGMVTVDADQMDGWDEQPDAVPRFYVTPRGRQELATPEIESGVM